METLTEEQPELEPGPGEAAEDSQHEKKSETTMVRKVFILGQN